MRFISEEKIVVPSPVEEIPLKPSRWKKVWLSRPWQTRKVPGSSMLELNGVRGYLVPGDISYLFDLAGTLPRGGCYLEVGSWLGLSSIIVANGLLANMNLKASIYCVDTWQGSPEHQGLPEVRDGRLMDQFLANVREAEIDCLIHPIRGDSTAVAQSWQGPPLDLVFIDGDHSLNACERDIECWRRRLHPRGRLLGHDAVPGGPVEQALLAYCRQSGCRASVCRWPLSHFIWELHSDGRQLAPDHEWLT